MEDKYALITTLVAAIVLAFVLGFVAQRLRLSPIVGYLLAGLAVGPYTPGFTGNTEFALQLSEIGVILLMFGVGLKISIEDIWSVRWIAVPGSLVHTLAAGAVGYVTGLLLGMSGVESFVLGASLSIASTIVFLRALEDKRAMKTEEGRIGISWLLIEDLLIVLAIVVLPAIVSAMAAEDQCLDWRPCARWRHLCEDRRLRCADARGWRPVLPVAYRADRARQIARASLTRHIVPGARGRLGGLLLVRRQLCARRVPRRPLAQRLALFTQSGRRFAAAARHLRRALLRRRRHVVRSVRVIRQPGGSSDRRGRSSEKRRSHRADAHDETADAGKRTVALGLAQIGDLVRVAGLGLQLK
jgi:hypothetical protein